MALVSYSLMYPDVLPEVPGCPIPLVEDAIRNAAIEFCDRSKVLKFEHPAINAVANQRTYSFVPPSNTVVSRIIEAWYNDVKISPKTPQELDVLYKNWLTQKGTPNWYTQLEERKFELIPAPDAALTNAIVLLVNLKPSDTSTQIEDRIQEEYRAVIAAGALANLMLMNGRPWANPQLAAVNGERFEQGIGKALMKSAKGFGRARLRTTPRYF